MRIVSDVYSEFGKALLGVGQAIVIAAIAAKLFTTEPTSGWIVVGAIFMSIVPTSGGLALIQRAYHLKKLEGVTHE